jgi:hypothetical protein
MVLFGRRRSPEEEETFVKGVLFLGMINGA